MDPSFKQDIISDLGEQERKYKSSITVKVLGQLVGEGSNKEGKIVEIQENGFLRLPRERIIIDTPFSTDKAKRKEISSGLFSGTGITRTGDFYVTGFLSASYYLGDGSRLTNLNISGGVSPAQFSGAIGDFPTRKEVTGVLTNYALLNSQNTFIVSQIVSGNLNVTGNISGAFFIGDGSGLTNLPIGVPASQISGAITGALNSFMVRSEVVTVTTGTFDVYSITASLYDTAFFDYVAKSGSSSRAGQIITVWTGSSVRLAENTTTDIGSTSALSLGAHITGSFMVLTGSASTAFWTIKTLIRII